MDLFQGNYYSFKHYDNGILRMVWTAETANMSADNFKEGLHILAGYAMEFQSKSIGIDCSDFLWKEMGENMPELMQWREAEISPRYQKAGVTKIGFLFPNMGASAEMMNQSPENACGFTERAFATGEEVMNWLLSWENDMKSVIVKYQVQPEFVETNKANIQKVMEACKNRGINNMLYSSYYLGEGHFMHHNITPEDNFKMLTEVPEFMAFQNALKNSEPLVKPYSTDLETIGLSKNIF